MAYNSVPVSGEAIWQSHLPTGVDATTNAGVAGAAQFAFGRLDHGAPFEEVVGASSRTIPAVCGWTGDSGLKRRTEGLVG